MKIKGKTSKGFKFEIDDRIKTDWRLLEAISEIETEDAIAQIKGLNTLVGLLLGDNKDKFIQHIAKNNDGYCPMDKAVEELREILEASNELKNS